MNIIIILVAMAAFPVIVFTWNFRAYNRLRLERSHDRMLYSLCRIRDEIAFMSLKGEISEESRIFKFFYSTTAQLIHNHRSAGICFRDMIRFLDKNISESKDWEDSLQAELSEAPKAIQQLANDFFDTLPGLKNRVLRRTR